MLAAALLVTACAAGDTTDPGGRPHRDLAATPQSLPPAPDPVLPSATAPQASVPPSRGASPTAGSGSGSGAVTSSAPGTAPPRGTSGASPSAGGAAAYRQVGAVGDGANDVEGRGPGYADLRAVTVEDDGTNARVTVHFHADVPARLAPDEQMGVGVDFFRSATQVESDYQLFADGQPEGWYAYLQTPSGFVRFPGRFGVGGRRLEFVVPWSAVGSPSSGHFSAFADWTRDATPANEFSEDHAPAVRSAAFTR